MDVGEDPDTVKDKSLRFLERPVLAAMIRDIVVTTTTEATNVFWVNSHVWIIDVR